MRFKPGLVALPSISAVRLIGRRLTNVTFASTRTTAATSALALLLVLGLPVEREKVRGAKVRSETSGDYLALLMLAPIVALHPISLSSRSAEIHPPMHETSVILIVIRVHLSLLLACRIQALVPAFRLYHLALLLHIFPTSTS